MALGEIAEQKAFDNIKAGWEKDARKQETLENRAVTAVNKQNRGK